MPLSFAERAEKVHGGRYDYSRAVYKTAREKVEIVCQKHGPFWQTPDKHISRKQGCPACKPTARVDETAFVARVYAVHGDALAVVPGSYTKMFSPVALVCPQHGEFHTLASNVVNKGTGCPKCAAAARGEVQRMTQDRFLARAAQVHGTKYVYSGTHVAHGSAPVSIECPEHGVFAQTPVKHLSGHGCPQCAIDARTVKITKTRAQFAADATLVHGGRYDYSRFEYVDAKTPGTIVCQKHGPFEQTPDAHLAGKGCSKCTSQVSRWEGEVAEFLRASGVDCVRTRAVAGVEFDIYAGAVAVECNGLYWHSDRFPNARMRHMEKTRAALAVGVRLIHLFEDEWRLRRAAVENLLLAAYGKAERVFARECAVVAGSSQDVAAFLHAHHIQGAATGSVVLTLAYMGETVAVMVFSKVRSERGAVDAGWELVRYASKGVVVGGASRLFARFLREYAPARVVSYSDNRLFFGGVYEKLGFEKTHTTAPQYRVVVNGVRMHKANFKKQTLARTLGAERVDGKTEREVCEAEGMFRVYDCGLTKWEYRVYS